MGNGLNTGMVFLAIHSESTPTVCGETMTGLAPPPLDLFPGNQLTQPPGEWGFISCVGECGAVAGNNP